MNIARDFSKKSKRRSLYSPCLLQQRTDSLIMQNSDKKKKKQKGPSILLMTLSIALSVILVSSAALSVGPFFIQSAWALPYVSSVSVSPSSTEKTKGETATYTVTVTRASGAGAGDVNLSFESSTIPSSAATFSSTKVNFGNGGSNSKSVTLTIATNDLDIQEHTFTVKGTKSNAASDSATSSSTTLTVTEPPNQPPTADAGTDQTVNEGDSVNLDGSGSSDPDGTIDSYSWTQTAGTQVTLSDASSATPSFTAPDVGADGDTLTFELTVTDNDGETATDTVNVQVNNVVVNQPPTADAGTDQTVNEGDSVTLDGSGSSDPDGDTLTYAWTQTAGTQVTLSDASSATPSFTAPDVGADGDTLTFELTVNDGNGHTATDTVNIVVQNINQAPTANAGSDFSVNEGTTGVQLQGSGSDADGTISSYQWEQVVSGSEPTVTLTDANTATATFDAPSVSANTGLTFKLTVTDNDGTTAEYTVVVTVKNVNQAPVASLTADPSSIEEGSTSTLDASASTDDVGIAEYIFEQVGGTAGTITVDSSDPSKAIFQAPSVSADETATIQVTVKDAEDATDSATVEIAVTNAAPHATTLTLNSITYVPWGKDITVTGKLTDNDASGAGIGGATISFDGTGADNLPDNVVTNSDGTFTAKGASPTTVATGWKVQAHFAGNSDYTASDSVIKTYGTTKHSVFLAITFKSTTGSFTNTPWSTPTAFTVTLTDASTGGTVIQGKTIHFDGTGVIGVADQTTGTDGKATGTGTAPNTVATGWTYQAHFAGDSLYKAKDSAIKTYSTTKHSVTLSLSVPTTPVAPGASYKVSGTLVDSTAKQQLASKTISFTADAPITIADKITNTNGFYSATQAAPSTSGTYNIQSHFAGDSLYNAKDSVTKTLTVS
jgi:hypothetical protein